MSHSLQDKRAGAVIGAGATTPPAYLKTTEEEASDEALDHGHQ